tara:strand:- start:383 stop:706 length:324 start_codon:yes stop_codon:yes gene_type:complete
MNNTNIYISSRNIDSKCHDLLRLLQQQQILSTVIPTKSVIRCKNSDCIIENGCQIRLSKMNKKDLEKDIWNPIKHYFDLDCAYIDSYDFKGCIKRFFKSTKKSDNIK